MSGFAQGFVLAIALVLLWGWGRAVRKRHAQPPPAPPPPAPKRRLGFRALLWLCILGLVTWAVLRYVLAG